MIWLASIISQLFTIFHTLISYVSEHKCLLAMEQISHLIEVVLIGCRSLQTVRQATLSIDTDMSVA